MPVPRHGSPGEGLRARLALVVLLLLRLAPATGWVLRAAQAPPSPRLRASASAGQRVPGSLRPPPRRAAVALPALAVRHAIKGVESVVPTFWQQDSQNHPDAVLKDGELDFSPWLDEIARSPHEATRWEEDGVILGQGAFGVVARGIDKVTGELVAIKRIPPTHALGAQTAVNEFDAAKAIGSHPNVIQMTAYFLSPQVHEGKDLGGVRLKPYRDVVLVYRLALGGSLQEWISSQHASSDFSVQYGKPKLTDESVRIMHELVRGLMHIHSKNIQHRDLKPANILLSAGGSALIADFGIALVNRTSTRVPGHAALGDFYFVDVDSLVNKGLPYTLDDDVYSLGEVFVRILYGNYGSGSELQRFVGRAAESQVPPVVRVVHSMLAPREKRCSLKDVSKALHTLWMQPLPSEPRPIVTETFLGIGAMITAATVAETLRSGRLKRRATAKSKLNAVVRRALFQGRRPQMQDFYCHSRVRWHVPPGGRSWRLFGIFDGHGGTSCARFAARFLPHEVRRMLRRAEAEELESSHDDAIGGVGLEDLRTAARALREALESLNGLFVGFKQRQGDQNLTGTTAVVGLLSPNGRNAVLCNIGDSRAALAGEWEVMETVGCKPEVVNGLIVTHAHKPSDRDEIARIEAAGGFVEYGGRGHRVNGVLGVSRAIGYAGVREYETLVPALADTIIARRPRTDKKALVAFASDALFEANRAETVFGALVEADDADTLDERIGRVMALAADGTDNASVIACLLPGSP